jgi:hypothetical protein
MKVLIILYLHPFPLHPNVVLCELHNLKDIQGARNHYLKLVEYEANEHVTVPWERHTYVNQSTTWFVSPTFVRVEEVQFRELFLG